MGKEREQYTPGYGPASTAVMAVRTAQSHAAFFLPQLRPGMSVLDCGCGPGSITIGFAEIVAPGQVVGTEIEDSQVALACENASKSNVSNIRFEVADIYDLPFGDSFFDAAFISGVLGNLHEPGRGLREVYRVLKPGGVIGVTEFDEGGDLVYPSDPVLKTYNELYRRLRRENGHDPEGGRRIGALLLEASFRDLKMSASYQSFADPKSLRGTAKAFVGLLSESWGKEFKSRGWATAEALQEMSDAWQRFAKTPGAFFASAWCEAVARKDAA